MISDMSVLLKGLTEPLLEAVNSWSPGDLSSERKYRDSLFNHLRNSAKNAIVEKEYRCHGTTAGCPVLSLFRKGPECSPHTTSRTTNDYRPTAAFNPPTAPLDHSEFPPCSPCLRPPCLQLSSHPAPPIHVTLTLPPTGTTITLSKGPAGECRRATGYLRSSQIRYAQAITATVFQSKAIVT
jgi:hypothetical protein